VLVVDASVVLPSCWTDSGFRPLQDRELVAPALMWSEVRSSLHEGVWRGDVAAEAARAAHRRLEGAPVRPVADARLGEAAWQIADELGWAKTYDAEYLALARILGCRLVTLDARLRRGADRLGLVVGPNEL
jgi:predicted nucleic acid-binding protein